jgi:hypothetical protein
LGLEGCLRGSRLNLTLSRLTRGCSLDILSLGRNLLLRLILYMLYLRVLWARRRESYALYGLTWRQGSLEASSSVFDIEVPDYTQLAPSRLPSIWQSLTLNWSYRICASNESRFPVDMKTGSLSIACRAKYYERRVYRMRGAREALMICLDRRYV